MSDPEGKISNRSALVAVMGLGQVGLPLALKVSQAHFRVMGIDVDRQKVETLSKGVSTLPDVSSQELAEALNSRRISFSQDPSLLREADVLLVCVPTPMAEDGTPDMSYVEQCAKDIARFLRPGQLVIVESTVYPGTTEELVAPILQSSGLRVEEDFHLVFSPERIDPGNQKFNLHNTPKLVAGLSPRGSSLAEAFYREALGTQVVRVSQPRVAEMAKLLENAFRSVNIALANEVALVCKELEIDVWEVISAASTKPFGFMPFYPGPGVGGHCIPKDPRFISWKARSKGVDTPLIDTADRLNREMPRRVVAGVADALSSRGRELANSTVLVLGVAYKKDTNDIRSSPALEVIRLLEEHGATVQYHDPFIPVLSVNGASRKRVELKKEVLEKADCVVIATDHSCYDYRLILENSGLLIDTRNATKGNSREQVIRSF